MIQIRRIPPVMTANIMTAFQVVGSLAAMGYYACIYQTFFGTTTMAGGERGLAGKMQELLVTVVFPWIVGWVAVCVAVLVLNALSERGFLVFKIEIKHTEPSGPRDGVPAAHDP